jgi:hypothetical protein
LIFCFAYFDGKSQNSIDKYGDSIPTSNSDSSSKFELGVNSLYCNGILENETVGSNCGSVFKNILSFDNQFVDGRNKNCSLITDTNLIFLIRKDIFFLSVLRI